MIIQEIFDELALNDHSPSSVVESASYDIVLGSVQITFTPERGGQTYSFPCSPTQWGEYRKSDSKGSALATVFGVHGGRR